MQFHILSFEGPDKYSHAGGIGSRITGLADALTHTGYDTHLWFVGDPNLPGHDQRSSLAMHRWCQWLSQHHPHGVYDGEKSKAHDYATSLPPYLMHEALLPALQQGRRAVILAEEWHTAHAVLHLDHLLRQAGLRQRVCMLWNANNTFGFEGIDWARLQSAAVITTVSRYMRQLMLPYGVDPLVLPNGLGPECFLHPDAVLTGALRERHAGRLLLTKIARFDPDKRWLWAMDAVAALKQQGRKPLLVARGGLEDHGQEVLARALSHGLRVLHRTAADASSAATVDAIRPRYPRHRCGDVEKPCRRGRATGAFGGQRRRIGQQQPRAVWPRGLGDHGRRRPCLHRLLRGGLCGARWKTPWCFKPMTHASLWSS